MKIKQFIVGEVQTNCYLVINETTKECLIIDPGAEAEKIHFYIEENQIIPKAVLLTHGHFDHAGAAKKLAEAYKIFIYAHEEEEETLKDPRRNVSWLVDKEESYAADVLVKEQEKLQLAGFSICVIHTPGHTKGGCCYYLENEQVLFSGDTLFAQSVGRTDFPGGSMSEIIRSIREKLLVLPGETIVYPGHNDRTMIKTERKMNPYL